MRTIPYSSVERGLAAIAGIDSENLLAHEKVQFAEYINDATKFVWEHYPWETVRVEKRYFRPLWVEGQNYEIGDEVFFKDKYYRKFKELESNTLEYWENLNTSFERMFSFGNSYSDSGNYPSEFWQDAQTVWTEYLSNLLNLQFDPSTQGGTNFAYGGARLIFDHYDPVADITIPSIQSQIISAPDFNETDLVTFFGGANDYIGDLQSLEYIAESIESNLNLLVSKGAKHISVLNWLNLSRLPAVTNPSAEQDTQSINTSIEQIVSSIRENNPDVKITVFDFYQFFEDNYAIRTDVFYDNLHLIAEVHESIAQSVYSQITTSHWDKKERDWFPFASPENSNVWHETGDQFVAETWRPEGLYSIGSIVKTDDGVFVCIRTPEGDALDGSTQYTNFSQNGINIDDRRYWQNVDTKFDRYIPFDQEGSETIGTLFSVFLEDPRYNSGSPLSWQLGREGIYIDLPVDTNEVWVKFREEPPLYSRGDDNKPVLNYLASAIKAYAYRSFLISDGQNEKAMLQEQMALDLLIKEIDKLVHQQDRGLRSFMGVAV